ncbi:MAG: hypothetical protein AB8B87_11465 [Granulosicoccus sp.]
MKSTLPAQHLLRQYLLFAFTVIFLLTMTRAGYALWQFPQLEETEAYIPLFVQGLRFDLALVGIICLVPVVLGSLLSMINLTRPIAKFIIWLFLFGGLMLILLLEMVTPWFIHTHGMRPDIALLQQFSSASSKPAEIIRGIVNEQTVPTIIAVVLCIFILFAFWLRMELGRFLRYRVSVPAALFTAIVCGILCVVAIWSHPDLRKPAFGPGDSLISTNSTVNDLAMNSTYKTLHSVALPYLNNTFFDNTFLNK